MPFDPFRPPRKQIQRPAPNVTGKSCWGITVVVDGRRAIFGEVIGSRCKLSEAGRLVAAEWRKIPTHHPGVELDAFVAMPDHLHGILWIALGATELSEVVRSFKARCTYELRRGPEPGFVWHRGYYEHKIGGSEQLERFRRYIWTNPGNWNPSDLLDLNPATGENFHRNDDAGPEPADR